MFIIVKKEKKKLKNTRITGKIDVFSMMGSSRLNQ